MVVLALLFSHARLCDEEIFRPQPLCIFKGKAGCGVSIKALSFFEHFTELKRTNNFAD
jgi:hypothetical protein